ncbi:hypothetical protein [Aquibacillus albus]|uniref:Uncharacterized protein n=1 Tax=Aquibacillus albus TaxID=1168171 RepID=A0ABS2MVX0_9BACI|nr:hypothetical protein [Aquibacillus albus]MBM7569943.1 hypothetical protein [Aquibacillus albus]
MPILCIVLVLNSVGLALKIKDGDENIAGNTAWITITFTLIMYSLVSVMIS